MADQQRIHPVQDIESPPPKSTAPLVPPGTIKSDGDQQPEPYPPFRRTIPVHHDKPPKKKRSCCCKCFCWTFTFLLLLVIIIGATIGILFLVFRPKLPKYSVDRLQITQFELSPNDSSLTTTFDVFITARNPNGKIGIYYEGGSRISVLYAETKLCEGSLPKFYQGHKNVTVLNIPLRGHTTDGNGLITAVQDQLQRTGNIPLRIRAKQPVRIKLGKLKLMKIKFLVKCNLVVDNLAAGNNIRIQSSSCKFRLTR